MNKFLTKIIGASLAIAMMIGVGVGANSNRQAKPVHADDLTYSFTINSSDFNTTSYAANNNEKHTTAVCTSNPNTTMEVYWTSNQVMKSGNNMQWQKNNGYIFNSTNLGTVNSVTVNSSAGSFTTYYGTTQNPSSGSQGANKGFFKTKVGGATGTTSSVVVNFTVSTGSGPTALADPNPQYNDSTKKVTWTTDAHATKYQIKVDTAEFEDISITPNPEYDASGLTTGVQHTVQIKAVGNETDYSSTTGSVQFTPTAPFAGKEYALCTSVNDLEAGAKYIFTSGTTGNVNAMSTESSDNNRRVTGVSVNAQTHRITSTQQTLVVELGGSEDHWTFETTNYSGTNGYFASSGSSNYLKVQTTVREATISFTNSYAVIHIGPSTTNDLIRYNSGSSLFSCYASGQQPVYLWKEFKELDHLDVAGQLEKTSYYDSETFDSTGITVSAVYTDSSSKVLSSNAIDWPDLEANMTQIRGSYTELGITKYTEYLTISVAADSLSTITLDGTMHQTYYLDGAWNKGTITVTANYASGRNNNVTNDATIAYYRDSAMTDEVATPEALGVGANQTIYVKATYNTVSNATGYAQTVSVSIEPGTTENNPLTAAAAVELGNTLTNRTETTKQYYIQGVVSKIVDNKLGQTGNYVFFWLQVGETIEGFEVYNITPAEGCENYNAMKVGAEVLIKCTIKKYDSTIETGSTKSLLSISYTAPTLTGISLNKTTLNFTVGDYDDLVVSPSPLGAETGEVAWSTSNQDVATVDQSGHVVAVGAGEATITATAGGFNATCNVTVSLKDTMEYNAGSTTNMTASGNAATVNLDPNLFTVDAAKGSNQNFPGLNKDDDIRAYSGNDIIVTINSNYTITNIEIDYASGDSYSQVSVNGVLVAGNNGVYAINSNSFKIHANGGMVKMYSVDIFYRNATAAEKVSRSTTQTQLSYRYTGNAQDGFEYSDISIRFGANITKALWDELDTNEHLISGFGVIIADGDLVTNAADMAEAMNDKVSSTVTTTFTQQVYAIDYFVPVANMASTIGEDANNYFWNLRWAIDEANMNKMYSAVAYIKVGDEYVLMNMARESVETLALDYLTSRGCNETTAEGSLQAIVDNAA